MPTTLLEIAGGLLLAGFVALGAAVYRLSKPLLWTGVVAWVSAFGCAFGYSAVVHSQHEQHQTRMIAARPARYGATPVGGCPTGGGSFRRGCPAGAPLPGDRPRPRPAGLRPDPAAPPVRDALTRPGSAHPAAGRPPGSRCPAAPGADGGRHNRP